MGVARPSTFAPRGAGFWVLVKAWFVLVVLGRSVEAPKLVFDQDGHFKIALFADRKLRRRKQRASGADGK